MTLKSWTRKKDGRIGLKKWIERKEKPEVKWWQGKNTEFCLVFCVLAKRKKLQCKPYSWNYSTVMCEWSFPAQTKPKMMDLLQHFLQLTQPFCTEVLHRLPIQHFQYCKRERLEDVFVLCFTPSCQNQHPSTSNCSEGVNLAQKVVLNFDTVVHVVWDSMGLKMHNICYCTLSVNAQ